METLAEDQLMQNFHQAIERLRDFDLPVLAFSKDSEQPFILITVLPPTQLDIGAMKLQLTASKPKGQPFHQTLYYGQLLDIPNIVLAWRGQAPQNEETCH